MNRILSLFPAILLVSYGATLDAHPGRRNKQGCHVCRTKCEDYGYTPGFEHCHDEAKETPPKITKTKAYVDRVLDGDTIEVRSGSERYIVRVLGIDCPESKRNSKCVKDQTGCAWQIPWGQKAAQRAAQLLKHQLVTLECPGKCGGGAYGRPLRYVRLADGRDYSLVMVREGYCSDYGWKYPHVRGAAYIKVQDTARDAKKGVWQDPRWGAESF